MNEARIDARNTHRSAATRGGDALTKRRTTAAFQFECGQHRFGDAALGFETHCIDSRIYPTSARLGHDHFCRVVNLLHVDRNGAVRCFSEVQSILQFIHNENTFSTQHAGTGGRHQPDRPRPEDGNGRSRSDTRIDDGLITGGQNIGQEQNLFVCQCVGHHQRTYIRLWHTHVFRLTTGDAAIKMRIAEKRGRRLDAFLIHRRTFAGIGGFAG